MNLDQTPSDVSLARPRLDIKPLLLLAGLSLLALPVVGNLSTWATLTIAGIGTGLIIFLAASGLTLVFGLMSIMNFGHGIFITFGAYISVFFLGSSTLLRSGMTAESFSTNAATLLAIALLAMIATALLGMVFEKVVVRPAYGSHLQQILMTSGGMVVAQELILALWGGDQLPLNKPQSLAGSFDWGGFAIEKYRLFTIVISLAIFLAMVLILNRTRLGLLIRAGVQDREMVEALGYRIKPIFLMVFTVGAALAGLSGLFWGMYQDSISVHLGAQLMVLIFIVLIIGGMGSVIGALIGALLVGLSSNYIGFVLPKVASYSNIVLMAAIILWRPLGLYPVFKR